MSNEKVTIRVKVPKEAMEEILMMLNQPFPDIEDIDELILTKEEEK